MKDASGGTSAVYTAGGLALGAAALACWQHYENVAAPPRIWLADGPLRERVLPHCSTLLKPFHPTPWAANRHVQTVLGLMRTLTMRNSYTRQLILAVDGATLGLDWFDGCDQPSYPAHPSAPILMVCHGVNGGSHEGYAKWACAAAVAQGWRAVVLNYRGCNGLPFTAPRGYAATMSHDVFTAVYSLKARFPSAPLLAVGYSLGGLKLTKYVAEADAGLHVPPPGQPPLFSGSGLAAAAMVSSPVDLQHSSSKLADRTSVSFLYNLALAYKLREHISRHRADIAAHSRFDVESALSAWTVADIEDRGLPHSLGFRDRHHYYAEASSPEYIPAITTPTLLLLAEDDPFLGVIPDVECSRNPSTLLALTRRGGHVAFLQGAWPLGRAYMDDAVMEFFTASLEHLYGYRMGRTDGTGSDPQVTGSDPGVSGGHVERRPVVERANASGVPADSAQHSCSGGGAVGGKGRYPEAVRAGVMAAAVAAAQRSAPGSVSGCCGTHVGSCAGHDHGAHGGQAAAPGAVGLSAGAGANRGSRAKPVAVAAVAGRATTTKGAKGTKAAAAGPRPPTTVTVQKPPHRRTAVQPPASSKSTPTAAAGAATTTTTPGAAASSAAASGAPTALRVWEQHMALLMVQQQVDRDQRAQAAAAAAGATTSGAGGSGTRAQGNSAARQGGPFKPELPRSRL